MFRRLEDAPLARRRLAAAVAVPGLRLAVAVDVRRQVLDAPQAVAAAEGGVVVPEAHPRRQRLAQVLGIAAAEHRVVGAESALQRAERLQHALAPFLLADVVEGGAAEPLVQRAALGGELAELQ